MFHRHCSIGFIICGALLGTLAAAEEEFKKVDPIFADDSLLEARLSGPLTTILRERSVTDDLPASFAYVDADGNEVVFEVGIRARGNSRRDPDVCQFPPLRLNFKKSETKKTQLDNVDKVKLVTHCKNKSDRYQQAVISEYLSYKILNLMTDISFQARLLHIAYIDTEDKNRSQDSFAFLIEHKDRLSNRIDAPELHIAGIPIRSLQAEYTNLVSVFQYLIGNTDFSPIQGHKGETCCHNSVPLGILRQALYSVPYDFDQAGLVNAPHAIPGPDLHLRSVTQRKYRGRCVNNEHIPASIASFQARRADILALVDTQPGITKRTRKRNVNYIEDFFKIIDDPKKVEKNLVDKCI